MLNFVSGFDSKATSRVRVLSIYYVSVSEMLFSFVCVCKHVCNFVYNRDYGKRPSVVIVIREAFVIDRQRLTDGA